MISRTLILIFLILFPLSSWAQQSLSLDDVSRLAINNSLEVQMAKYDALISHSNNDIARSIYDAVLTAEVQYRDDQSQKTSSILATQAINNNYKASLSQTLPTGTTLDLAFQNDRNTSNSTFTTLSPSHDSVASVTLTQEIGKNFFGLKDRGQVKVTRLEVENSEYLSIESIESHLARVQKAYWDLILAHERKEALEDIVDVAKQLYDLHQERMQDGIVNKADAYHSEANYQSRLNELSLINQEIDNKTNILKLLLNIENLDQDLVLTDNFQLTPLFESNADALKQAFDHRRDYKRVQNDVEARGIELIMAKNESWPEMNLTLSLARNGVAGHFDDAARRISSENNSNFFAGFMISFPWGNAKAKAELKQAELDKAKTLLSFKLIERQITVEVINQVRQAQVLYTVAKNHIHINNLQKQKLAEEQKRFDKGKSDTDTIIRFQEDYLRSQIAMHEAAYNYYAALIDLQMRKGILLDPYWEKEGV